MADDDNNDNQQPDSAFSAADELAKNIRKDMDEKKAVDENSDDQSS